MSARPWPGCRRRSASSSGCGSARTTAPNSGSATVRADDARAQRERARAPGARILMEPTDFEYGERQFTAEDPAGHQWTFSETLADVAPEEWGRGISLIHI